MAENQLSSTPPSKHVGDFPLKDKICVVTGGGNGINYQFARLAHAHGARILIADLRLSPEAEDFLRSSPSTIAFQKTDVCDWDQLSALIPSSVSHFSDVPDVYIAGAGVFDPPWTNFWDDTEPQRYAELDINTGHPIKLTRLAMRALVGHGKKGVVLSIASTGGLFGAYSYPLYSASKWAVVGFTRAMAPAERLEGVKVVTICPGVVNTSLWDQERRELFGGRIENAMGPAVVAEVMVELVEKGEYGGGTVLEMSKGRENITVVPPAGWEPGESAKIWLDMDKSVCGGGEVPRIMDETRKAMEKDRLAPWPQK